MAINKEANLNEFHDFVDDLKASSPPQAGNISFDAFVTYEFETTRIFEKAQVHMTLQNPHYGDVFIETAPIVIFSVIQIDQGSCSH